MSRAHCLITVLFLFCTPAHRDLNSLQAVFSRHEFIPSLGIGADGWAEARRRQILKAYFKDRGHEYFETQLIPTAPAGKYRDTSLHVKGHGESAPIKISFVLKPAKNGPQDEHFRAAQGSCDKTLFSFLREFDSHLDKVQALEFSPTENCLDLTTQLRLQD